MVPRGGGGTGGSLKAQRKLLGMRTVHYLDSWFSEPLLKSKLMSSTLCVGMYRLL